MAGVGSEEVAQEGLCLVLSTQWTCRRTTWLQVVGCVSVAVPSSLGLHAGLGRTREKDHASWEALDPGSHPGGSGDFDDVCAICKWTEFSPCSEGPWWAWPRVAVEQGGLSSTSYSLPPLWSRERLPFSESWCP